MLWISGPAASYQFDDLTGSHNRIWKVLQHLQHHALVGREPGNAAGRNGDRDVADFKIVPRPAYNGNG